MGYKFLAYMFGVVIFAMIVSYIINCKGSSNVYKEYERNVYHKTPVCDSITGMDEMTTALMEYDGKVYGTEEIDEKDVYYDKKFKMCEWCFSPFEIKSRQNYINNK